jgi:hypothetical protein
MLIFIRIDSPVRACYIAGMKVQKATDWQEVSRPLMEQMRTAPHSTRKDLARMIAQIDLLVHALASEEVVMRRERRDSTLKQQKILPEIEEAIANFERYVFLAHLGH